MTAAQRRLLKQPRVGDTVVTAYGDDGEVLEVRARGERLLLQTPVHGTVTVDRASSGWWTVLRG